MASRNFAQMSTKKLQTLLEVATGEEAEVINDILRSRKNEATWKKLDMMSDEALRALIVTADQEERKIISGILARRNSLRIGTFIVIKKIGECGEQVIRKFDDERDARQFANLCIVSEEKEFITYSVAIII